ncbi:MAG: helix-turn-helix transcriptional regulator [Clostridia bacterium]|nr:helix-turn-helix transcriptional regulator [Clostridia bacterium]
MDTLEKILNLLREQKKTQKQLMDHLGLGKTAFTGWKNGDNQSYNKHIGKIAEFFGVSTDYLLGIEKEKSPTANSDETLMFALYGNDNKDVTPAMLEDIRNFAQYVREKERNKTNGTGKPI